jgi:hypothetical protein
MGLLVSVGNVSRGLVSITMICFIIFTAAQGNTGSVNDTTAAKSPNSTLANNVNVLDDLPAEECLGGEIHLLCCVIAAERVPLAALIVSCWAVSSKASHA